jgi:hypothetical protein
VTEKRRDPREYGADEDPGRNLARRTRHKRPATHFGLDAVPNGSEHVPYRGPAESWPDQESRDDLASARCEERYGSNALSWVKHESHSIAPDSGLGLDPQAQELGVVCRQERLDPAVAVSPFHLPRA